MICKFFNLYPPHSCIHHLMTFMRYEGKYIYNVWNRLYQQYLGEFWMGYYCVTHWLKFLRLKRIR